VRASFFFPQVFLCEPEPEENFSSKKKAELEHPSGAFSLFTTIMLFLKLQTE
jgi:hypothetical protein